MRATTLTLPLLSCLFITALAGPGVGQAAAVSACRGFPNAALKCLTDISFTVCLGEKGHGSEQEFFVNPGTHCEQGILGKQIDLANVAGVATATNTFVQFGTDNKMMLKDSVPATATATGTGMSTQTARAKMTDKLNSSQIDALFATTA